MKKIGLLCILSCFTTLTYSYDQRYGGNSAQYTNMLNSSMYVEYAKYDADWRHQSETVSLDGVSLGVSSSPYTSGWYGQFSALSNDDYKLDYYEFSFGLQQKLFNYYGLYALATAGIGYSWADSDWLNNTVNFVSLPVGLELGFALVPELTIYGGIGYKWLWDVTSDAKCNDGELSYDSGHKACSWQGGVNYYYDQLGDNNGVTYKAGLRYNF